MFRVERGDGGVLVLSGRFDAAAAEDALDTFRSVTQAATLDCTDLDYISSAGIGLIVETYKRLRENGMSLRLVHASPRVRNVFTYAGLDRIIPIE